MARILALLRIVFIELYQISKSCYVIKIPDSALWYIFGKILDRAVFYRRKERSSSETQPRACYSIGFRGNFTHGGRISTGRDYPIHRWRAYIRWIIFIHAPLVSFNLFCLTEKL